MLTCKYLWGCEVLSDHYGELVDHFGELDDHLVDQLDQPDHLDDCLDELDDSDDLDVLNDLVLHHWLGDDQGNFCQDAVAGVASVEDTGDTQDIHDYNIVAVVVAADDDGVVVGQYGEVVDGNLYDELEQDQQQWLREVCMLDEPGWDTQDNAAVDVVVVAAAVVAGIEWWGRNIFVQVLGFDGKVFGVVSGGWQQELECSSKVGKDHWI